MLPQVHLGDFIQKDGRLWMSAAMLGSCLGYSEPRISIFNVYHRNKEELEPFQGVIKMITSGGAQKVQVFDQQGCYIIAMLAKTDEAKRFRRALGLFLKELHVKKVEYYQFQHELETMRLQVSKQKLQQFYGSSPVFKSENKLTRLLELRNYLSVKELGRVFNVSRSHISKALRLYRQAQGDFSDYRPANLQIGGHHVRCQ